MTNRLFLSLEELSRTTGTLELFYGLAPPALLERNRGF